MRIGLCLSFASLAAAALVPTWSDPTQSYLSACAKVTTIFDVPICLTTAAYAGDVSKYNHIANVVAQLLDNDADGVVDDATVHNEMVTGKYFIFVPLTEEDAESFGEPSEGKGQMSGLWESVPNSCDVPTNRGATSDRSTWAAAKDSSSNCDPNRDATTEEVLHLITEAAATLYPSKWGKTYSSDAGAAIQAMNGGCGNGVTGDFKDPSGGTCTGQYAYDDATCDVACLIVEGIYWASVSYMGGLYTTARVHDCARECYQQRVAHAHA